MNIINLKYKFILKNNKQKWDDSKILLMNCLIIKLG